VKIKLISVYVEDQAKALRFYTEVLNDPPACNREADHAKQPAVGAWSSVTFLRHGPSW
jgi:hypothetical protein